MATSNNTYHANCLAEYPESSSRILAFLGFLFWIKLVALIPHFIVLFLFGIISLLLSWIGYLAVIFTGKYPRGLFDFQVGVSRWNFRVSCWFIGLADKYPPFSLK